MPEKKAAAARSRASSSRSGMTVDTKLVRELADMLADTGLTEIVVEEGDKRIRVARDFSGGSSGANLTPAQIAAFGMLQGGGGGAQSAPAAVPDAAGSGPSGGSSDAAGGADHANAIKSPMVGTVYLAPEPGADNFVNIGDKVKKGDTLLIVEAMKVMNPIASPKDGTLQQLLVGNGDPVEFDQPLAIVA